MLLRGRGAVTGWGALRMAGAGFFDGLARDSVSRRPVLLVAGPGAGRRPRPGVRWLQDRLAAEETWIRQDVRCTRPERALFDEMRLSPDVRSAVVAMDMAAAADLTSIRRMRDYAMGMRGWNGLPGVRAALGLADENSRSPAESRMRLVWVLDAHLPRPLANRDVFDDHGRLLGIADLIDPVAGVVGEFDGAEHAGAARRSRDAGRDTDFRDHGLEVFRVTGYDEHRPEGIVARARSSYARAAASTQRRRWTLEPPPGWPTAPTLDEQLDVRDLMRRLHA